MDPLDPSDDEARRLLEQELQKPEYQNNSPLAALVERILTEISDRLATARLASLNSTALAIGVALALIALFLWLVSRIRRSQRSEKKRASTPVGLPSLNAQELWLQAQAAFQAEQFEEAILYGFRGAVAQRIETGALPELPGMTAFEAAEALADLEPARASEVRHAGVIFDQVRYGDEPATRDQAQLVLSFRSGVTTR
jgi:hypothetical protein